MARDIKINMANARPGVNYYILVIGDQGKMVRQDSLLGYAIWLYRWLRSYPSTRRLLRTKPRCIYKFDARPIYNNKIRTGGHGEPLEATWRLRCQCGCEQLLLLGHQVENDRGNSIFVGPLAARCSNCGCEHEVFSIKIHGWDGEVCGGGYGIEGDGERQPYLHDRCGAVPLKLDTVFAYDSSFNSQEYPRVRRTDTFTWFTVLGHCSKCGKTLKLVSYECA